MKNIGNGKSGFSDGWVQGLIKRANLKRRRITSDVKDKPSVAEVQCRMNAIQNVITERKLDGGLVFNFDETGVRWAEQLKYQYVPTDAQRAENPEGDTSGRFKAMIGASDIGDFAPMFAIVQVNCKTNTDLSTSRTLQSLLKAGLLCDPENGWRLGVWEGVITKLKKDASRLLGVSATTTHYKRPYLINDNTLAVITVQHKAWMDSPACMMWAELQLGPWRQRHSLCQAPLAVLDNCGCHHVSEVQSAFEAAGWILEFLPPNMTGELQPMDLVVNGPLKQRMRQMRIASSLEYFQSYRLAVYQAMAKEEPVPKFKAPVPKMRDGLRALCEMYTTLFASEQMVTSLVKCFQSVGLAVTNAGGCASHFTKYQLGTRHGSKPTAAPPADNADLTLGGMLLPICSRCGCDEDGEPNGLESGDEDEDGSEGEFSC